MFFCSVSLLHLFTMRHSFSVIFLFLLCNFEFGRSANTHLTVTEKIIRYDLAGNTVPIKVLQFGDRRDVVLISLHDDEATSVDAAKRILQEQGGMLIELENYAQRNIRFRLGQSAYKVDPNRIFSREGIKKSMEEFGQVSARAITEVERLGQRIIQLIPGEAKFVIALHNNTPGLFNAKEYSPGSKRSSDTKKIYLAPEEDPDDFFLTTDKALYEKLADKGFNTILQDNKNCNDDGSLSVYCGKKNIRYVNCETEHGKAEQYYRMMETLFSSLNY